ncbi:MAG: hypothetical protein QOC60_1931 [Frankiaceae bacterium]|jgi:quercetin dioxygenase-like cupin family protein|nr:hypothetical protein [Frankiaceae bacterium]
MSAVVTSGAVAGLSDGDVLARMADEGLEPSFWTGSPGQVFAWHEHPSNKILYAVSGALTFTLRDGSSYPLIAGDRIDLAAHTDHAATVGPEGVRCIEGYAS